LKPIKTKKRRLSRKKRIVYAKKKGSMSNLSKDRQHHSLDVPLAICSSLLGYWQLVVYQWSHLVEQHGGDRCHTKRYTEICLRRKFTGSMSSLKSFVTSIGLSPTKSFNLNASVTNSSVELTDRTNSKCPYKVQAPEQ